MKTCLATLGNGAPHYAPVKNWVRDSKCGRESIEHNPHSCGRPVTTSTPENIDKVHDLVVADRLVTVADVAKEVGISTYTARQVFKTDTLQFHKCVRDGCRECCCLT